MFTQVLFTLSFTDLVACIAVVNDFWVLPNETGIN